MTDDVRALADLATPMAVRVAATLRLADHAGERGATLEQLAAATETSAPAPTGFDAYLVCDIVHDWDDERARVILGGCRDAAAQTMTVGPGTAAGRVVLVEPIRGRGTRSGIDLFMLTCIGGERSIEELTTLATDSGLILQHHAPGSDGRTVLEFAVA